MGGGAWNPTGFCLDAPPSIGLHHLPEASPKLQVGLAQ